MKSREEIINNYIAGYNELRIDRMVQDFDETFVFENINNGSITLSLTGKSAFIAQAEQAKAYFSNRKQTVTSLKHQGDETEVAIDYYAVVAMDLPNGLKKSDELKLQGKSIFLFRGDKIIRITDIS